MGNVFPISVDHSRTKLDNYNDEKYDQVAIKYLIEKIVNECQTTILPMHSNKINVELVKSLREQIENL